MNDPASKGPGSTTPKDAEREERRAVDLHGYALREDGSTTSVTLCDLSYEGCGIRTPVELRPSELIKLSVPGRGRLDARVQWYADGKAGLAFESVPASVSAYERQTKRVPLTAEVSLRRLGSCGFRVGVHDASPDGCKVDFVERVQLNEKVSVKFEGLESLEAEVCWVDGPCAGLKFVRAIHPAVFDLLLMRLGYT